ncbi:MAG: FkbM family methyltransferase [Planctomycetes bacterium]|nr:FkbM family methyltransferase [Planctomycetota bacterium]
MTLYERLHMLHRLLRYRWRAERAELRFLLGRRIHGGSVLDIGAHRGVYSYWMHRRFTEGTRVVAFEPQPELARHLADFKQAFHLDRMLIEPVGLSSQSGTLPMHRPRKHWGAATVDEFCYDDDQTDVFDVPVTTIDEYLAAHPELRPVRFIKCDVEYHEAEVLAGAERILRDDRPEILLEWSTPRRAYRERLFRLVARLNYAIFQFEYGRLTRCTSAERHSPPSWELGPNYLLLPHEIAASAAA